MIELLFGQTPFKEGTTIDTRRGVALKIDQIATMALVGGIPEVVHAGANH